MKNVGKRIVSLVVCVCIMLSLNSTVYGQDYFTAREAGFGNAMKAGRGHYMVTSIDGDVIKYHKMYSRTKLSAKVKKAELTSKTKFFAISKDRYHDGIDHCIYRISEAKARKYMSRNFNCMWIRTIDGEVRRVIIGVDCIKKY